MTILLTVGFALAISFHVVEDPLDLRPEMPGKRLALVPTPRGHWARRDVVDLD